MSENELQSLKEIFNKKFFRIPDFQRGYSWQKPQLEDFWEDLINLKEDKTHYTGLLTVDPISKSDIENSDKWQDDLWLFDRGFKAFYIIDGQQRLTTSMILINEILNKFTDSESINSKNKSYWVSKFLFQDYSNNYKSYMFGYERDNPSDEFFKTKILKQESPTADKVPEQTLYTSNLEIAKNFFNEKLKELKAEKVQKVFKKFVTNFKFNFYKIDNDLDIYVTFETMNNRGKPLSNLELLKNRLIYLSTLLDKDDQVRRLRTDINETWKTIYEYLGKNKFNQLDDDEFLRDHWIMYFDKYNRKESASYAKFLLNNHFTVKQTLEKEIKLEGIKEYIDSLAKSVKYWFYLYNPHLSNYSDEIKEWMQKLNRLGMGSFTPLFMAAMIRCNEEQFLELLKAAEKFNFLIFNISRRPSNTKNSDFYKNANLLYRKDKKKRNISKIIEFLAELTRNEINLENFERFINEQFKKGQGFYTWKGLKYFLFEYELSLQEKAKESSKITWKYHERNKEDSIEHIYPQTATDSYWKSYFGSYSDDERKILLNSLGVASQQNCENEPLKLRNLNKLYFS